MKFCIIRRLFDWTTIVGSRGGDLIYAKRSNILFEIAIAPHLISNINQALFYTHLTWRWGSIHLGKPPDKESTISHFQFPFECECECFVQIRKMSFREIGIDKSSGTASYIASQMVWTMSLLCHRQPFVNSPKYGTVGYACADAVKAVADSYKCQAHWCLKSKYWW